MAVTIAFWSMLSLTLVLLGTALVTGRRRLRRAHLWVGPLTMLSLLVTVLLAEQLVRRYEFPERPMAIHLVFAKTAGFLALPVIVSGVWLVFRPGLRRLHQVAVGLFVLAAVIATGTGLWIFSLATERF